MTETFKNDDFVQEKSQEKGEYAEGLCFDKIVWIFMISCIVGFLVETLWCLIKHGYIESRQSIVLGTFSVAYAMCAVVLHVAVF